MADYNVKKEIAAIGVCMDAVNGLELSEALRVIAYTLSFLEMKERSEELYRDSRKFVFDR